MISRDNLCICTEKFVNLEGRGQDCMNYSADVDATHDTQLSQSDELQIQSLADHYIRMLSRVAGG